MVRAAAWASENDVHVIALTGFGGGRTADLADVNLHVDGDNYGVVEDAHQSIMHMLAQYLRLDAMAPALIPLLTGGAEREAQLTAVKEIVRDLEIAQAEVERLNRLNGHKNCRYYWQTTRLFGPGESFGTHRPAEGQP